MSNIEELFSLAKKLNEVASKSEIQDVSQPLDELEAAVSQVQKSFSGSWLGYHSRIYYKGFKAPPPGAHFSQEWGLKNTFGDYGSRGHWKEFQIEDVKAHIEKLAGKPSLKFAQKQAEEAENIFEHTKSEINSIIQIELDKKGDGILDKLNDDLEQLKSLSPADISKYISPEGQIMTRDTIVFGQGSQVPPHISYLSEVHSIRHSFNICTSAEKIAIKVASHLEKKSLGEKTLDGNRMNVFIGHGQSLVWHDLKDFLQDRLKLRWDEFNRLPVAGVTNIARLSEMLDSAAIAFVIMTAEDERADGGIQARMNVVHEAGLFQGRLGFTKAVVLLEEGCDQFSNIEGLGQIRFPKGNIKAVFEEIRKILERERLLDS